jgi:hypothetical protein
MLADRAPPSSALARRPEHASERTEGTTRLTAADPCAFAVRRRVSVYRRRLLLYWAALQRKGRQVLVSRIERPASVSAAPWKSIPNQSTGMNRPATPTATFCATLPPFTQLALTRGVGSDLSIDGRAVHHCVFYLHRLNWSRCPARTSSDRKWDDGSCRQKQFAHRTNPHSSGPNSPRG